MYIDIVCSVSWAYIKNIIIKKYKLNNNGNKNE